MNIISVLSVDILISKDRQRKFFDEASIIDLAASITKNGLIQPIVIRETEEGIHLVAGERRLKAMEWIWNFDQKISCGEYEFAVGCAPCLYLGDIDPVDAYEIELEENIRRADISWQERATATARLLQLRNEQAALQEQPPITPSDLAKELAGVPKDTPIGVIASSQQSIVEDLIVARNLDNPLVAKAASKKDAIKIIKSQDEARRNAELSRRVGSTFGVGSHRLLRGDCLSLMADLPANSFDCILSDPPYGIDAQEFNNSGGLTGGGDGAHFYDDSHDNWIRLMSGLAVEIDRLSKPECHLYLFCDIDRFQALRDFIGASGQWKVFRTPLIWHNPQGMRAPWPDKGPQRKYQLILFAVKGGRNVTELKGDVLIYPNDPNAGHPAQKPVALLVDLLRRSLRPGDTVLDPFTGSGSIFPAAHSLKISATGIELDESAAGIATKRLGELK